MEADLKNRSKPELLSIIEAQDLEILRLADEIAQLKTELKERNYKLEQCGSIAEAALAVNHVFESAQAAADEYLENARRIEAETVARCNALDKAAVARAEQIIGDAARRSEELLSEAALQANEAINRAAALSAEKLGEADSVLRSAREDSNDIRDAALRFFIERSGDK